ncbi:hypothetical protein LXL04_019748 [Taraxacum kok-saghyz]
MFPLPVSSRQCPPKQFLCIRLESHGIRCSNFVLVDSYFIGNIVEFHVWYFSVRNFYRRANQKKYDDVSCKPKYVIARLEYQGCVKRWRQIKMGTSIAQGHYSSKFHP